MKQKQRWAGVLFSLPFIMGFLLFSFYPIAASLVYSFSEFNLFKPLVWVGLDNYRWLFESTEVAKSIRNTLFMVCFATPTTLIIGLLTAQLLSLEVRGQSIFRTLFYIPTIVPIMATSLLWIWVLNPKSGLINSFLQWFGIRGPNWLLDAAWTKPSLMMMDAWASGGVMIIFLAALQNVPRSLYESAVIDGAGSIRKFVSITLPSISPIILFQLIMAFITYFQYFGQAFVMSSVSGSALDQSMAGPENSMLFYTILLYREAFVSFRMGHATAMAWGLFLITALVTFIIIKTSRKWVTYGGE